MHPPATIPSDPATPATVPLPAARLALALLISINLFNYIDRQVLAAVEPQIRAELFPETKSPDVSPEQTASAKGKMGLLSSAFLLCYMLAAPIFGVLAERWPRWLLIGAGVVIWSLASGASGINWGTSLTVAFGLLFLTRCLVGVGEAAYGPVAPALLSDLYPVKQRGQILAWFYVAIPVGGAIGYVLGEIVSQRAGAGAGRFIWLSHPDYCWACAAI